MGAERTFRRPRRPRAYALVIALAALILAAGVAGTWSLATGSDGAPSSFDKLRMRAGERPQESSS